MIILSCVCVAECGNMRKQWVFLAEPSTVAAGSVPDIAAGVAAGASMVGSPRPWLLAAQLLAAPEALPFLDAGQHSGAVVSFRDLRLVGTDPHHRMWQAEAADVGLSIPLQLVFSLMAAPCECNAAAHIHAGGATKRGCGLIVP